MTANKNNKNIPAQIQTRRVGQRYININEDVFQALSPYAYKAYTALRFDADYNKDCASVSLASHEIADLAGISRAEVYRAFNEIEKYGLLYRESKPGKPTIYWVAKELHYFELEATENIPVSDRYTPVSNGDTPVSDRDTHIDQYSYQYNINNIKADSSNSARRDNFEETKKELNSENETQTNTTTSSVLNQEGGLEEKAYKKLKAPQAASLLHPNPLSLIIGITSDSEKKCFKKQLFGLKNILNENAFQIPEAMILDWFENRKKKKAPITKTAWTKINKELAKCKEQGIDPIEAFEEMVASGWQSIKVEYFRSKQTEKPKVNNLSTEWGSQVFTPFHEIDLGV